tara:strand:+ start:3712 stop:4173 length:462 start_codon:yes stop_codon:yes gene_type:complete
MKTLQSICVIILLTLISGCTGQARTTAEILKNEKQREEIMTAISNDHVMMDEMIGHMMESDHAMQMMEGHQGMMGIMMGNRQSMMNMMAKDTTMVAGMMNNMMAMMEKDSTMCNMMSGMMMGNKHMMDMMQQMGKSGTMMKGGMMHQNQHKEQ